MLLSLLRMHGCHTMRDAAQQPSLRLFLYLPWHNTHDPLEAPDNYLYNASGFTNYSFYPRQMYNAMARALDEGMRNITDELKSAGLYEESLILFSAEYVQTLCAHCPSDHAAPRWHAAPVFLSRSGSCCYLTFSR